MITMTSNKMAVKKTMITVFVVVAALSSMFAPALVAAMPAYGAKVASVPSQAPKKSAYGGASAYGGGSGSGNIAGIPVAPAPMPLAVPVPATVQSLQQPQGPQMPQVPQMPQLPVEIAAPPPAPMPEILAPAPAPMPEPAPAPMPEPAPAPVAIPEPVPISMVEPVVSSTTSCTKSDVVATSTVMPVSMPLQPTLDFAMPAVSTPLASNPQAEAQNVVPALPETVAPPAMPEFAPVATTTPCSSSFALGATNTLPANDLPAQQFPTQSTDTMNELSSLQINNQAAVSEPVALALVEQNAINPGLEDAMMGSSVLLSSTSGAANSKGAMLFQGASTVFALPIAVLALVIQIGAAL